MSGDALVARELTERETQAIKSVFDYFDVSGDGKLSLEELEKAMSKVAPSIHPEEIKLIVDDIDENGDNEVDYDEFFAIMRKKLLGLESEDGVIQAFSVLDKDQNGFISPSELRTLLTTVGRHPLTEEEADELISRADVDGDGLVSYVEFLKWLSGETKKRA